MGPAALALILALPVHAAAETAAITLTPERSTIGAGEPVRILGTARYPAGARLAPEPAPRESETFSVLDVKLHPPEAKDGGVSQGLELTVAAFALGRQNLPALVWTLGLSDGSTQSLRSPPVPFEVEAPAAAAAGADIKDLRPPIRPFDPAFLLWLLLAAAAGAAGWALWRRLRKTKPLPPPPPLPPHEEALERLRSLLGSGLWERGEAKAFYVELSDILRLYLERRFGLPALRLTTPGLVREMRLAEIDAEAARDARFVLETADLVKFARLVPDESRRDADCSAVQRVVESTAPLPPEPAGVA